MRYEQWIQLGLCLLQLGEQELLAFVKHLHTGNSHHAIIYHGSHNESGQQQQPQIGYGLCGKPRDSHHCSGGQQEGEDVLEEREQTVARQPVDHKPQHKHPDDIERHVTDDHGEDAIPVDDDHDDDLAETKEGGAEQVER